MTSCQRGDVVLVPFDFTDRSGVKWRPAVVVSTDDYNRTTPDVLIVSITSNLRALPHPGALSAPDLARLDHGLAQALGLM